MLDRQILMYDFEVFSNANWWMVVIIDYNTSEKTIIVDDKKQLQEFYNIHKDDIWVGYNSRMYDQWILKAILLNQNPCKVNDLIINNDKNGYQVVKNSNKIKLNNFDVSTGFHSLKQLEAYMGSMIKESSISFDKSHLTPEDIKETIKYCIHDVEETIKVFTYRKEEFDSQLSLINAFNLDMEMFNKTKAQLSAHILNTINQHTIDDEFNFILPSTVRLTKYKFVLDWYKNPRNWTYSRSLNTIIAGVPHTFAYGGVHGARLNYYAEGIILCCDIGSMYPASMINYNLLSRNVLNPEKYREIRDARIQLKKNKDPKQLPMKIVLNN